MPTQGQGLNDLHPWGSSGWMVGVDSRGNTQYVDAAGTWHDYPPQTDNNGAPLNSHGDPATGGGGPSLPAGSVAPFTGEGFQNQTLVGGPYWSLAQQANDARGLGQNTPIGGLLGRYAALQAMNPNSYHGGQNYVGNLLGNGTPNPGAPGGGAPGGGSPGGGGAGGGGGATLGHFGNGVGGANVGAGFGGLGNLGGGGGGSTNGGGLLGNLGGQGTVGSGFGGLGNVGGGAAGGGGGSPLTQAHQNSAMGTESLAAPSAQPQPQAFANTQATAPAGGGGYTRNADGTISMRDPNNPWNPNNITIDRATASAMPDSYWQQMSQSSSSRLGQAQGMGTNQLAGFLSQAGNGHLMLNPTIQGLLGGPEAWRGTFNTAMNNRA